MDKNTSEDNSLLGFIVGILAGAATGILLAPYAGKESRKRLANEAKSFKTQFTDAIGEVVPAKKIKDKKKKKIKDLEDGLLGKDKKKKSKKGKKAKNKEG